MTLAPSAKTRPPAVLQASSDAPKVRMASQDRRARIVASLANPPVIPAARGFPAKAPIVGAEVTSMASR